MPKPWHGAGTITADFQKGSNELLLKVVNELPRWNVEVRLTATDGSPAQGIRVSAK